MTFCMAADVEDHFIGYFTSHRTEAGLILDRVSDPGRCSTAAAGFGMDVEAIRAIKGAISRDGARHRIRKTLCTIWQNTPTKNHGWLYHFTSREGYPSPGSEISTIDTALFYHGALQAARRLDDTALAAEVRHHIAEIDLEWAIGNSPSRRRICHGFWWSKNGEPDWICHEWDEYNEGILVYRLFNLEYTPTAVRYDLPLFCYYYPMAFLDEPALEWHLRNAIQWQREHLGYCGVTATDTEHGYEAFPKYNVSPVAWYCVGVKPPLHLPADLHSYNVRTGWRSEDRIGIDEGAAVLLKNRLRGKP